MFLTKKKYILSTLLITFVLMSSVAGCNNSNNTKAPVKNVDELLMMSILDKASSDLSLTTYDTQTVETGELSNLIYTTGNFTIDAPVSVRQPYEHGDITFVKYNVSIIGDSTFVEEGTSLATLKFSVDPVAREEARIALGKAQSSFNKGIADKARKLEQLSASIDSAPTFYERQLLTEEYSAALIEYDEYIIEQEEVIAELQDTYDTFLNETIEFDVLAPASGLVAKSDNFYAGDLLDNDADIFYIYPLDELYITARSNKFNYGETVTILYIPGTKEFTFEGVVVSSDNILYNGESSTCRIAVNMADLPDLSGLSLKQLLGRMDISVNRSITDNGIIVPALAFDAIRGNTGVITTYSDNTTYKSNVKIAYRANNNIWVIGGLNEGDLIVN